MKILFVGKTLYFRLYNNIILYITVTRKLIKISTLFLVFVLEVSFDRIF